MSEEQLRNVASLLGLAASKLQIESCKVKLPNGTFLNQAYKETKQLQLEVMAYLGDVDVTKIQEPGVTQKTPSLKVLEKLCESKEQKVKE